eukprot:9570463-Lingulodinium_polyedra.AAC.1
MRGRVDKQLLFFRIVHKDPCALKRVRGTLSTGLQSKDIAVTVYPALKVDLATKAIYVAALPYSESGSRSMESVAIINEG